MSTASTSAQPHHWLRRVLVAVTAALVVAALIVELIDWALDRSTVWPSVVDALGIFITSPGFGGVAAFLAAAVAFLVAKDRLDDDRVARGEVATRAAEARQDDRDARDEARRLTEQDARDERWWKLFELLVDKDSIVGASNTGPEMALELKKVAQTQLQKTGALLLVEMYELEGDDEDLVDQEENTSDV